MAYTRAKILAAIKSFSGLHPDQKKRIRILALTGANLGGLTQTPANLITLAEPFRDITDGQLEDIQTYNWLLTGSQFSTDGPTAAKQANILNGLVEADLDRVLAFALNYYVNSAI